MKVDSTQGFSSLISQRGKNEQSTNEAFAARLQSAKRSISMPQEAEEISTLDLSKYDKFYNDSYYDLSTKVNNYNTEDDGIKPVTHKLSDGVRVYFPSKNAPDEVKTAFFEGLQKMSREERKLVGADILNHFDRALALQGEDTPLHTSEQWERVMGDGNVSYQSVFKERVSHFQGAIAGSNDSELIKKLKMHLNAHQAILDTLIEHGIH